MKPPTRSVFNNFRVVFFGARHRPGSNPLLQSLGRTQDVVIILCGMCFQYCNTPQLLKKVIDLFIVVLKPGDASFCEEFSILPEVIGRVYEIKVFF